MAQLLMRLDDETEVVLTTDSSASSYGIPVLTHMGCDQCHPAFGPGDLTPSCICSPQMAHYFGAMPHIADWICKIAKPMNPAVILEADRFLWQWCEGPQLPKWIVAAAQRTLETENHSKEREPVSVK